MARTIGSKNKTTAKTLASDPIDVTVYRKAYYQANKEHAKAYNIEYYAVNGRDKEKVEIYNKAYYQANKEKARIKNKAYNDAKKNKNNEDDNEEIIVFKGWANM